MYTLPLNKNIEFMHDLQNAIFNYESIRLVIISILNSQDIYTMSTDESGSYKGIVIHPSFEKIESVYALLSDITDAFNDLEVQDNTCYWFNVSYIEIDNESKVMKFNFHMC